jgi:hypothetical protein
MHDSTPILVDIQFRAQNAIFRTLSNAGRINDSDERHAEAMVQLCGGLTGAARIGNRRRSYPNHPYSSGQASEHALR